MFRCLKSCTQTKASLHLFTSQMMNSNNTPVNTPDTDLTIFYSLIIGLINEF